jgi:hypothetical protein
MLLCEMHEDAWMVHGDVLEPPDYSCKYTEADMKSIIKVYWLVHILVLVIKVCLLFNLRITQASIRSGYAEHY